MTHNITEIIGSLVTLTLLLGYLPQTIHTIRTRKTDDIALGTFLLLGIGSVLFCVYGVLLGSWQIASANGITAVLSAIIFGIKMYNDHFKNKKQGNILK